MRRRGKNRQRAAAHRKNIPIFGILTGIAGFFFLLDIFRGTGAEFQTVVLS